MNLEIGVPKSPYNLCKVFMCLVKTWYLSITITVSTNQGKNVDGWRLLPDVLPEVSRGLKNRVQNSIKEIKSKQSKTPLDSEPRVVNS